jgi:putative glutamine amidotransferase
VPAHAILHQDPALAAHHVDVEQPSRLHQLYGSRIEVNSLHHQTVDRLGAGLVVAARAEDGTIEGIEMPGRDVIAVQWHPEMAASSEPIFGWLVERARAVAVGAGR